MVGVIPQDEWVRIAKRIRELEVSCCDARPPSLQNAMRTHLGAAQALAERAARGEHVTGDDG